jgi:dTDP-6-deoxy-L-talose 4-dehydrogenase (NAD+)
VTAIADRIVDLTLSGADAGVVNICSGQPVTVEAMVRAWAQKARWTGRLNLGHYPYPDYEPMEFWGDASRLTAILGQHG